MDEAQATYCFCGCGTRVKHPRLIATNTNGWELSDELAEWTKLEIVWSRLGLDLSDELQDNLDGGHGYWRALREAIHSGERADQDDEAHAVVWRKKAKKARRKLSKRLRRDGMLDPFEFEDISASELTAWIEERREPTWASELGVASSREDAEGDGEIATIAGELVVQAVRELADDSWEWTPLVGEVVTTTADRLSQFREDYNLVLDALSLGYWVRESELSIVGDRHVLGETWKEPVRRHFDRDGAEAVTTAMGQLAEHLPDGFAAGADVWVDLVDFAIEVLEERGERILAMDPEFDGDVELSARHRDFCFRLGYGLATTVDALDITATRPRQ